MNEPTRLRQESGSALEHALLNAGASTASSAETRAKTLAALGLAGSATLLAGTARPRRRCRRWPRSAGRRFCSGVSLVGAATAVPVGFYVARHARDDRPRSRRRRAARGSTDAASGRRRSRSAGRRCGVAGDGPRIAVRTRREAAGAARAADPRARGPRRRSRDAGGAATPAARWRCSTSTRRASRTAGSSSRRRCCASTRSRRAARRTRPGSTRTRSCAGIRRACSRRACAPTSARTSRRRGRGGGPPTARARAAPGGAALVVAAARARRACGSTVDSVGYNSGDGGVVLHPLDRPRHLPEPVQGSARQERRGHREQDRRGVRAALSRRSGGPRRSTSRPAPTRPTSRTSSRRHPDARGSAGG